MTMNNNIFFKEQEVPNGIVHGWSNGLGSHAPQTYGESNVVQSKLASLDRGVNQFCAPAKEHHEQGLGKGNGTTHFTLFSDYDLGECKTAENMGKTQVPSIISSAQAATVEYRGHFELGFGPPLICAKYPYAEQYYGVYPTNGAQIGGRIMLPLSMADDGVPIFVNAKQYNGIMRRRKKRAELELENKVLKSRKPYLHLSRHLHAMRRARGSGGRFLNTKNSNSCSDKIGSKKKGPNEDKQHIHATRSQISEVGTYSTSSSSRSTSPGSEVSSHPFSRTGLHPFQMVNHHIHPSFQPFPIDGANTGLGNYLKV